MAVIWFAVFLVVSHFGVMQIFRLTTYHAYFWKALPLLVIYSAVVAWILFILEMHQFFIWQLVLASAWLFFIGRKQTKMKEMMLIQAGDDAETVRMLAKSASKTSSYYMYSSIVYVVCFAVVYLWLYN